MILLKAIPKAIVTIILFLIATAFIVLGTTQWSQRIYSTASIKTVGVDIYADANFTVPLVTIDWGIIGLGETKNCSAYIVNRSNVPITLNITTLNWQPSKASTTLNFFTDYDGRTIEADAKITVTFFLTVAKLDRDIQSFSFEIIVTAIG